MRKFSPMLFVLCVTLLWTGAAHAQRFVDNGDGTITDNTTHLMWEKKTTGGGVHDVNSKYTWSSIINEAKPSGTAFVQFLGTLNHNSSDPNNGATLARCFANHCDWRLPSITELASLFEQNAPGCSFTVPCIDPKFGPTQVKGYWSATTVTGEPWKAYQGGNARSQDQKDLHAYVRAVRGTM